MKTEKEVLEIVELGCGCESYYRYQCMLCRMVGSGDPGHIVFTDLCDRGILQHGKYAPYELTAAGKYLLKQLQQESCKHEFGGRLGGPCKKCGKTSRDLAHPEETDSEEAVRNILAQAAKQVAPQVAKERAGERVTAETMNFMLYGE